MRTTFFVLFLVAVFFIGCTPANLTLENAVKASRDYISNIEVNLQDDVNKAVIFQETRNGRLNIILNKFDFSNGYYIYESNGEQGQQFEGELGEYFTFTPGYLDRYGKEPMVWGSVFEPDNADKIKYEFINKDTDDTVTGEALISNNVFFNRLPINSFYDYNTIKVFLISENGQILKEETYGEN